MLFRWLTLFLDFPAEAFDAGVAFWREVTGSELSPFRGPAGEFATLLPPDGDAYLRVQRTADGSGGCHLDLHVDRADPLDQVAGHVDFACASRELLAPRHAASGARVLSVFPGWTAMTDPTGRPYCLTRRDPAV